MRIRLSGIRQVVLAGSALLVLTASAWFVPGGPERVG